MPQDEAASAIRRLTQELHDTSALAKHLAQATTALREGHALLYAEHRALVHCIVAANCGVKPEQLRYQASIRFANSRLRASLRQDRVIVMLATQAGVDAFGGLCTALGLCVPKNNEVLQNLQVFQKRMRRIEAVDVNGGYTSPSVNGVLDGAASSPKNVNLLGVNSPTQFSMDAPPATPTARCFKDSQDSPTNPTRAAQVQRIMAMERKMPGAPRQLDGVWPWPEELLRTPWLANIFVKLMGFVMASRLVATGWRLRNWLSSSIRSLAMNVPPEIFVFGGATEELPNCSLRTVESYNISFGCWKPLEPMREGRSFCATVTHGGYIYVIGGTDGKKTLPNFDRFDVTKKETDKRWEQLTPMSGPRKQCAACAVSGKIYVVDGLDRKMGRNRLETYDVATGTWTSLDVLKALDPAVRVAAVLSGRLYFVGLSEGEPKLGMDTQRMKSFSCRSFHPNSRNLKKLPSLETPPFNDIVGSTSSRDKVYIFGTQISLMCIFNARVGNWDPPVDAKRLPINVRAVKTTATKTRSAQLLHMGYVTEQDPESPGAASNVFALQTWTLLPPYKAFRTGAGLAVMRY